MKPQSHPLVTKSPTNNAADSTMTKLKLSHATTKVNGSPVIGKSSSVAVLLSLRATARRWALSRAGSWT
eukprot:9406112-Pyramimonas_sp.AAC.1